MGILSEISAIRRASPYDPATWPEAWRERREERAAIMEHDGGLPRDEAERAATFYAFAAMRPESFLAQWADEAETMRRGDCPDWLRWTPAARAGWAQSALDLAQAEGFLNLVPSELAVWLRLQAQEA